MNPFIAALQNHKTTEVSYEVPLNWLRDRENFIEWLGSKDHDKRYAKGIVSYLDRYVKTIKNPLDAALLFGKVEHGKNHLIKALRVLFNFYEVLGYSKDYLDSLRKALPKVKCGIDLKIPSEAEIVDSLRKARHAPIKYEALYNLLVDSGLRLVEAVYAINNFQEAEKVNGFYRYEIALFRGSKQAYYAHFTEHTLGMVKQVAEKLNEQIASTYFDKSGYVNPKYIRKFVFDKMIELEIPESVANFIEGRVPKRIGAKHYMALARQASNFYPRYVKYVQTLRRNMLQNHV